MSSVGMLSLLCWLGYRVREEGTTFQILAAVALPLLLFFDPVFYYTAGKTWNHEVPSALILAAVVLQVAAVQRESCWLAILSGFAGGFAVGTRLTFAPILLPLCLAAAIYPGSWRTKITFIWWSGVGVAIGLLPSFALYLKSPENFIFGNFEFPRLRLLDPENTRIQKTMRLSSKLRYFFKDIVVPSLPLYLAFCAVAGRPAWRWITNKEGGSFGSALVLACLPFALAGCFAPSRYQYQHYFGVNCLIALGVAIGLRPTLRLWPKRKQYLAPLSVVGLTCASIVMAFLATDKKQRFVINFEKPEDWFYAKARRIGEEVRAHVPKGPILTLAPAWPLEAGLSIYPQLAAGPFGWRSAPYASEEQKIKSHLIGPEELEMVVKQTPPAGILTGVEDRNLERPLVEYAKRSGWRRVDLSKKRELWVPE